MVGTSADIALDRPTTIAAVAKRGGVRRDIQGLRAVAVVVVILDHAIAWPPGGFVGVDVFFVLSGFLITGLLLREHDRSGRISIADFYRRRARRILPVSYLVLVITVIAAAMTFTAARLASTLGDAFWTMLFSVNWHLALVGTDYMQAAGPVSPLQHYWSLAVEEQFYFVWPVVLIGVLALSRWIAGRRGNSSARVTRRWGFAVLAVLSSASLAWAMFESVSSPTFAYFSTFSRAWELGAGALVALMAAKLARLSASVRVALAWTGLLGIAVSLFVITPTSTFPAPWALLPVIATVLIVVSGVGFEARFNPLLTNRVSRYIGDISYSLYLWHWPVIVFTALFLPLENPWVVVLVLAIAFALSVFSYHFVENPVRESGWLEPRGRQRSRVRSRASKTMLARGWFAAGAVATVVLLVIAIASNGVLRVPDPTIVAKPQVADEDVVLTAAEQRTTDIAAALSTAAWPATDPALDTLAKENGATEWISDACLNIYANARDSCIYGDPAAPKLAVLLGDSTAVSYLPGLREALEPQGYRIHVLTMFSCPAWNISVGTPGSESTRVCDLQHSWVYDYVAQLAPDMVVMSSLAGNVVRLNGTDDGEAAVKDYGTAAAATLATIAPNAGEIVVIGPPPGQEKSVTECKTPMSRPGDCVYEASTLYRAVVGAEEAAVATVPDVARYVDVTPWLCNQGVCPAFIGTAPVSWDGIHLTDAASEQLGPLWKETLFPEATDADPTPDASGTTG